MDQFKTKEIAIVTKSVRLDLPMDLHTKCNVIKAHRFIQDLKEPSLSELCIELINEALSLPKYSKSIQKR